MNNVRVVSRLDIKGPNLIKGVHLEGLRIIGDPEKFAKMYYDQGVDEIIYMDVVASLYGRNSLVDTVKNTVKQVFVPITVGGGIRSVDDARKLLRNGADKIALNTAAVQRPQLLTELAEVFGSQCVVLSVEAKLIADQKWEAYTDNGRERTGIDVLDWCQECVERGAGEILLTSVDREGTRSGYDQDLVRAVSEKVGVPVIASGGMGKLTDFDDVVSCGADAVAVADMLHYQRTTVGEIKEHAIQAGLSVRQVP